MKKINLNSVIKVKLTPKGADIFYHKHDELNKHLATNDSMFIKPRMPNIDENGYTKFQLWDFINIYGKYFKMGMNELPIQDLNIYIEDEDLEDI